VAAEVDQVLIEGVAEVVDRAISIVAPIGRVIGVEARMVATEDARLTALTGGLATGASAGDERGTIAANDELLQVAERAALGGRQDG
jgi:hypothetical protein